ncbi:MAG: hypothetical protein JNM17_31495 [Archangium sp.]|nr:hypothetical protein [Archangium sp.]
MSCHPETIATSALAQVQRCAHCGCISVHLGPVTVRVDEAGLKALTALFDEANRHLALPATPGLRQ